MLNMDLNKTVVVKTTMQVWEGSPSEGVWRKPLAREAVEHGHTTSLVRFDPDSSFTEHSHPFGEKFLCLMVFFQINTVTIPQALTCETRRVQSICRLVSRAVHYLSNWISLNLMIVRKFELTQN